MTCICPTRANRRRYLPTAIQCFQGQTYPNKELLILQDGKGEDLGSICRDQPNVRFLRYPSERAIGTKRNLCCELAMGEIILHWDDDDWSFSNRIREQVDAILAGPPVAGYRTLHFFDERTGKAHEYRGGVQYVVGTSLAYRRSWWQEHKFRDFACGEDNDFRDRARGVLAAMDGLGKMVALTHGAGTSPRHINRTQWRSVDPSELPWRPT